MFEARAKGKPWGRPRFKPRRKYKSFTLLQAGWELLNSLTRFVLESVSTNTLSPVIYLAILNVAQSNGTLSAIYISVC